jgi:hypothetical protein
VKEVMDQMPTAMLKQLSSKYVVPVLKSAGFTKHGLIWNRQSEDVVHVLEVLESRWSDEEESTFGIGIGIAANEVHEIVWGKEQPKPVREVDCFPRYPIGYLPTVNLGRDIHWKLRSTDEIDQSGPEVMELIRGRCMPLLDRCQSIENVLQLADGIDRWKHPAEKLKFVVLNYLVGRRTEATEILAEMLANPKLKAWHDRVRGVSERLTNMA